MELKNQQRTELMNKRPKYEITRKNTRSYPPIICMKWLSRVARSWTRKSPLQLVSEYQRPVHQHTCLPPCPDLRCVRTWEYECMFRWPAHLRAYCCFWHAAVLWYSGAGRLFASGRRRFCRLCVYLLSCELCCECVATFLLTFTCQW